ncbi:MAG: enoyl-CoA hydratase-related protein, partial [Acinetobacter sp.]
MSYQFLQLEQQNQVATVWINRAELHNSFNTQVIEELHACFQAFNSRDDVRVVVLAGRGKSFSAGADLNWMKQA